MKALKIIGHPVLLISLYLLLIIEGDQFGGFYLLYLVMAIPHGVPYAIVALIGLLCVFTGYKVYRTKTHFIKPTLYLLGFIIMLFSLVLFFGKGNKWSTFELTVPLLTFIIFGVCSLCFLVNAFYLFIESRVNKTTMLKMI